jgi:ATP-dependent DNA helicase RecG
MVLMNDEQQLSLDLPTTATSVRTVPDSQTALRTDDSPRRDVGLPSPNALERLKTPLSEIAEISPKRLALLDKLGIKTVEDCLEYFPPYHLDRSRMVTLDRVGGTEGVETVEAEVVNQVDVVVRKANAQKVVRIILYDGTGLGALVAFGKRALYLKQSLKVGTRVVVSGRFKRNARGNPPVETTTFEYEALSDEDAELVHTGRLVPVYRLTEGLPQRALRTLLASVVAEYADDLPETLPVEMRRRLALLDRVDAVRQAHYPDSEANASEARRRLVFEEFLLLQVGLLLRRRRTETEAAGIAFRTDGERVRHFLASLPFALTDAQRRVVSEIEADMAEPKPMNRLLQGDVGSGKTVVAAIALLHAVENGYQGAIMAPTEILAEQHSNTLSRFLEPVGALPTLLRSEMPAAEKRDALERIRTGDAAIVVGTHALIQDAVEFANLGLVITDEQHRFGVLQRAKLRKKGVMPDTLVMTATPIPRTLALTAYGDLAVSVIDELPPGRTPVQTKHFTEANRPHLYRFIESHLAKGRQAYVIYPLIEESEKLEDVQAATEAAQRLAVVFPKRRVGLLHGRLSSDEKQAVMRRFHGGELDLLVSTTVVEVGVDVPNATIMVIENVERFGLAQLHQLRGRVGRGEHASYCALVGNPRTDEGRRRVAVMVETNDGFRIAEEDLLLRGPGEILGTRQAGLPDLKIANLVRDGRILEEARHEAQALVVRDPELRQSEHAALREQILRRWRGKLRLASVG